MAVGPSSLSNHLSTSNPPTSYPVSISFWVRSADVTAGNIFFCGETPTGDYFLVTYQSTGKPILTAFDQSSGGSGIVATDPAVNDEWTQIVGIWSASNSRTMYINGGDKQTNTVNRAVNVGGFDQMQFGHFRDSAFASDVDIAEVGVWDVVLNDDEAKALGVGYSCHFIRPDSLIHHLPLVRNVLDFQGDMQDVGSLSAATHPPIIGAIAV